MTIKKKTPPDEYFKFCILGNFYREFREEFRDIQQKYHTTKISIFTAEIADREKIIFDKPSVFSAFSAGKSISFNYSIFGQKTRLFYRIMDNFRKMTLNILRILT